MAGARKKSESDTAKGMWLNGQPDRGQFKLSLSFSAGRNVYKINNEKKDASTHLGIFCIVKSPPFELEVASPPSLE